jgi:CRISPR-associated protein Cmr2
MSNDTVYTAITFAPVQGFIEKSRKLRDLYGSSFILSYLARALCNRAKAIDLTVVSPAIINVTQGTPNQIIIQGDFSKAEAEETFNKAWKNLVECCRTTIQAKLPNEPYTWQRAWNLCSEHTWELFWAQTDPKDAAKPDRIGDVRRRLNEQKRSRAWTGINWSGESSTLSGADAIAYPQMVEKFTSIGEQTTKQKEFFERLSAQLSESIIAPNERLSIPELIKRLVTLDEVAQKLNLSSEELPSVEIPSTFVDINRYQDNRWTAWFQGDGDQVGKALQGSDAASLKAFSKAMMTWGKNLRKTLPNSVSQDGYRFIDQDDRKTYLKTGRIIYAGGDDFLGVLYRNNPNPKLTAQESLNWFYGFNDIWNTHQQKITVSVGFVWAAPNVPQRDVLQHCREAEKSAKDSGRDHIAIRILFNGGNTLEWTCPWWFLDVFTDYRDRNDKTGTEANWNHIFQDIATLEARHAFEGNINVALELFRLYFGEARANILCDKKRRWNCEGYTGLLGSYDRFPTDPLKRYRAKKKAFNHWIINLAKVGFHLHREKSETVSSNELGDRNNLQPNAA